MIKAMTWILDCLAMFWIFNGLFLIVGYSYWPADYHATMVTLMLWSFLLSFICYMTRRYINE